MSRTSGTPIQLNPAASGNVGASVGINAGGLLAVTYQISGFDPTPGIIFADIFLATTQLCDASVPGDMDGNGTVDEQDIPIFTGVLLGTDPDPCQDGDPIVDRRQGEWWRPSY